MPGRAFSPSSPPGPSLRLVKIAVPDHTIEGGRGTPRISATRVSRSWRSRRPVASSSGRACGTDRRAVHGHGPRRGQRGRAPNELPFELGERAEMWKTSRPSEVVVVSMLSCWLRKPMTRSSSSMIVSIRCFKERLRRSRRQTTRVVVLPKRGTCLGPARDGRSSNH